MKTIAIGLALLALAGCAPGFYDYDGKWTTYAEVERVQREGYRPAVPTVRAPLPYEIEAKARADERAALITKSREDSERLRAEAEQRRLELERRQATAAPRIETLLRAYGACMRRNALAYALATTEAADIVAAAAADTCDEERLVWSKARDDVGLVTAEKSPDFREGLTAEFRRRLTTFVVDARAKAATTPQPPALPSATHPPGMGI